MFGCTRQPQEHIVTDSKVAFRTLVQNANTFQFEKPWTFLVRSEQDENGFMRTSLANQPLPKVDYSKEMVICLLAGKSADSTSIATIDSIIEKPTILKVYSHVSHSVTSTGGGYYPAHIVALQRMSKGVQFEAYP